LKSADAQSAPEGTKAVIDAGNIAAILLAAGTSQRFGADDKLLAPFAGEPLALHAARRIALLAPRRRIAICRDDHGTLARLLAAHGFEIAANPHPEQGLSRSLSCGIAEAARGPDMAAMVCLADMPFVGTGHLRKLIARFDPVEAPVVASTNGDAAMPPALFARALFETLRSGEGDRGGKALLADAALIHAAAGELVDIDRPSDLPE
jgi:molybdenum cofactor cytidylyltransferase